jgi:hypothetical protein
MISFGTCTSALASASNGLVGVLTTFRDPDKGRMGDWSLVCVNVFPVLLDLPMLTAVEGDLFSEKDFCLRIRDQYL